MGRYRAGSQVEVLSAYCSDTKVMEQILTELERRKQVKCVIFEFGSGGALR